MAHRWLKEQDLRDIFADACRDEGLLGLERAVRDGYDNSIGTAAAYRAMRTVEEKTMEFRDGALPRRA